MRPLLLSLLLLLLVSPASAFNPVANGEQSIAQGHFRQGLDELLAQSANATLGPADKANVLLAIARFHLEFSGDVQDAQRYFALAASTDTSAHKQVEAFNRLMAPFAEDMARLQRLRNRALIPGTRAQQDIADDEAALSALALSNDFPARGQAYYYLGLIHLKQQRYNAAYNAFVQSQRINPAIAVYLPIGKMLEISNEKGMQNTLSVWSKYSLHLLWMLGVAGFFLSRPWQWTKWQHLAIFVFIAAAWCAFLAVGMHLIGTEIDPQRFLNRHGIYTRPMFAHFSIGDPGSEPAVTLLLYGLVGACATSFVSIASSRLRSAVGGVVLATLFGVMIFATLGTTFYLRHCQSHSTLISKVDGDWKTATLAFPLGEVEPYILTDPETYSGMCTECSADPYLQAWMYKHISPERKQ